MTLKITNDAQAEAARKYVDALNGWGNEFGLGFPSYPDVEAALSAYEAQKTLASMQTLTQDEDAFLRYTFMNNGFGWEEHSWVKTRDSLDKKKLLSRNFDTIIVSDLGRAYLAQKPKLRWEVHCKCGECDSFRGAFDNEEIANQFKNAISSPYSGWDGTYEVREVQ